MAWLLMVLQYCQVLAINRQMVYIYIYIYWLLTWKPCAVIAGR